MAKIKIQKSRLPASKVAEDVFAFILGYYSDNEIMPTLQEIADNFSKTNKGGVKCSRQWAWFYVRELEKAGKVRVIPRKMRGIELR